MSIRSVPVHIALILLIHTTALIAPLAYQSTLSANYFASANASHRIVCESYEPADRPIECTEAYGTAASWSAWTSFVSSFVLGTGAAPALGHYSDLHGRKPFLCGGILAALLPVCTIAAHVTLGLPYPWVYPASALAMAASPFGVALSSAADIVLPAERSAVFGVLYAAMPLGMVLASVFAFFSIQVACASAVGLIALNVAFTLIVAPETLPVEVRQRAKAEQSSKSDKRVTPLASMRKALSIICRTRLFLLLTAVIMLAGMTLEGFQDIMSGYLIAKLEFTPADMGVYLALFGVSGLVTQIVLLPLVLSRVRETGAIVLGLGGLSVSLLLLAFAQLKWQAYAAVVLSPTGMMVFAAVAGIKSNNVEEHEQGSVQGAIMGARNLAQGIGPLLFAGLFKAALATKNRDLYGLPLLVGAIMLFITMGISTFLHDMSGAGKQPLRYDVREGGNSEACRASARRMSNDSGLQRRCSMCSPEHKRLLSGELSEYDASNPTSPVGLP